MSGQSQNYNKFKWKELLFGAAATAVLLVFLGYKVSLRETLTLISGANYKIIIVTMIISVLCNILLTSRRWQLILKQKGLSIPWVESLLVKMGGDTLSRFMPMKAGEISRIVYLNRVKGFPYESSIFSVWVEYVLNLLVLAFFVVGGAILILIQVWQAKEAVIMDAKLSIVLAANSLSSVPCAPQGLLKKGMILIQGVFKEDYGSIIKNKSIMAYSLILLGAQLLNFYLIALAFGVQIPLSAVLLYLPLIIVATCIPASFAGMGFREALVLLFYAPFASSSTLLSIGLFYSFVEFVFPSLVGSFFAVIFLNKLVKGTCGGTD